MHREQLYAEYAGYHRDVWNRRAHAAGIPSIVVGLMGLLALLHAGPVNGAIIAAAVLVLYYAAIDPAGAAVSAVVFFVLYLIATHLPWGVSLAAFLVGWMLQLAGHRLEGNRPKFLDNFVYLLVGPLYFFRELLLWHPRGRIAG